MNVALIAARGTIYAAVKAAISSHTSGIFCLVIGIFSLISLFFATIGGTKAIENHRDSNVSVWFVWHSNLETSWRSNSLTVSCGGAFFLFIYLFSTPGKQHSLPKHTPQSRTYGQRNQGRSYRSGTTKKPGANIRQVNRLGNANCPIGGGWAR